MSDTPVPPKILSLRDPVHGFIRADAMEAALINSPPLQRLRNIHQLGLAHLVFPGAEHSRFSHALGAMALAGRVYDALAEKSDGLLPTDPGARQRRLVRAAALLHDTGHAPFSHSAEELFDQPIDHEEMTRRLLTTDEVTQAFKQHGDGIEPEDVLRLLRGGGREGDDPGDEEERLLCQVISGELDVDKMDYLLRDSLYCGVRYGHYDLDRLVETIAPLYDPQNGWGIGVEEGGVHALEALVMARYYMFTQVYFNVTCKALELHLNEWMQETERRWPSDPVAFLEEDDITVAMEMRGSDSRHARAVVDRAYFPLAYQTREHLKRDEKNAFEALIAKLREELGHANILVSNSAKNPHRLGSSRVLVRRHDGQLESMESASHFIGHLERIDQYRVYTPERLRDRVAGEIKKRWG